MAIIDPNDERKGMVMVLEQGRPVDCTAREAREVRTYDLLDRLHVPYERIDHPAADTMEICRAIDLSLNALICKNLFLCNRQGTAFYLLMMPGDKPFRTKELSAQIGSARLSFATAEKMEEYLDIHPGSVSVLGLANDKTNAVQLLIDEDVLKDECFGCHPCVNTSSLRIRVEDLIHTVLPAIGHTYRTVHLTGE